MATAKGWVRSKFSVYMNEQEKRVRAHQKRISIEMQGMGLPEGNALKQCYVPGCY